MRFIPSLYYFFYKWERGIFMDEKLVFENRDEIIGTELDEDIIPTDDDIAEAEKMIDSEEE